MLRKLLTSNGYTVVEAASGEQALEALNETFVDLVITDLNMPGMGGLSLAQRLLEAEQRTNTRRDATDDLYNEIQAPLLLAILYLLFQLPVTNKYLRKYLPPLFGSDGNQNPVGHVVISIMFASAFYGINLFVTRFSAVGGNRPVQDRTVHRCGSDQGHSDLGLPWRSG